MTRIIIVASGDPDQFDALIEGAKAIDSDVELRKAFTVEQLQKSLTNTNPEETLVIVAASLSQVRPDPDPNIQPGLDFVKKIQNEANPPRCIVVSYRLEDSLLVQPMPRCQLLVVGSGTEYVKDCRTQAIKLGFIPRAEKLPTSSVAPIATPVLTQTGALQPAAAPTPAANCYGIVEIKIRDARNSTVKLTIVGPQGKIDWASEPEPLRLNSRDLTLWLDDSRKFKRDLSRALGDDDRWRRYLKRWPVKYSELGTEIYRMMSQTERFSFFLGKAQGVSENIRLRFDLDWAVYDGLWEAIADKKSVRRYLMLDNTVTRRVYADDKFGTRSRKDCVRILVVAAPVDDYAKPAGPNDLLWKQFAKGGYFRSLPNIDAEVRAIENLAAGNGDAPSIEVVVLRGDNPSHLPLHEKVEQALRNPKGYDIVHFAGHALFDEDAADRRGYLVFSGRPKPHAIPMAEVAGWLSKAGVQLLYLSCCRGNALRVAQECARNHVPMTIGFNTDIKDDKAVEFATSFYTEFAAQHRVCSAFQAARESLYKKHQEGDPIWAIPVLLAQPMDWTEHIESALA